MTQEQIKQAAEEYADRIEPIRGELEWVATRDDFIAGAEWAERTERKMNNDETLRHCIEFAVGVIIGVLVMFFNMIL